MKKTIRLSEKEEKLMEFFWTTGKPLTSVEILHYFGKDGWNETFIYRIINSLQDKGLLHICGVEKYKTQYARKFEPLLTKEEYMAKYLHDRGMKQSSIAKIVMALFNEEKDEEINNDELIMQLEDIVKKLRKEKEK